MIKKGIYKIIELIDISNSLLSQRKEDKEFESNSIFKALITNDNKTEVTYFVDPIDFGAGTEINIFYDKEIPLLKSWEYQVLVKKLYTKDNQLIEKLLKKH